MSTHTLAEDLDLVVARTRHERFRELCDPAHPDHQPGYERTVRAMAAKFRGEPPPPLPPLMTRVVNFVQAATTHVAAGMPQAPPSLVEARLAVCRPCDRFVAPNACSVCGCNLSFKASWLDQQCPLNKWATATDPPTGS